MKVGDRVRWTEEWLDATSSSEHREVLCKRKGTVVGDGTGRGRPIAAGCVSVLWDGLKVRQTVGVRVLESIAP